MKRTVFLCLAATLLYSTAATAQSALNLTPSRVVGQPALMFRSSNPNVVQGREFLQPWAVVVDRSSTPAPLFVSDFGNHRVLGWRDSKAFTNGAPADLVVGQLDLVSTQALGPGTSRPTGMNQPGALAIDSKGNLYVVDGGNNRILRFPKPFESPEEVKVPNLVIGQPTFNVEGANTGGPSERTVAIASGNTIGRAGLAFDTQGNLWFSDPLNHRVLRYPASALDEGVNGPAANLVLGQPNFTTIAAPPAVENARLNKTVLRNPSGLAVDGDNRVYVGDDFGRVLVYTPGFVNAKPATRVLGVAILPQGAPFTNDTNIANPESIFLVENRPAVVDPAQNRILIFDPFSAWPAETPERPSPAAKVVIGQPDFTANRPNRGQAEPSANALSAPLSAFYVGPELYIADSGNHRVLVLPQAIGNTAATRVLGQMSFNLNAPNLVEGNELFLFNGFGGSANIGGDVSDGGGVVVDTRSNPPRLYISDTFNNRVLGYKDARRVRPGDKADLVIGQNDFNRTLVNAPQNNRDIQTASSLFHPSGLAVDKNGDLFVADSGNGRVLRFPSPFETTTPPGERPSANLVIGQQNFTTRITDPSSRNMAFPFGLALTFDGSLVVSDSVHNRVLFFRRPAAGDFTNGLAAEKVIGQPDFFTVIRGPGQNRLASPRHLAIDTDDRLYVADAVNNRLVIYDRVPVAANDPAPAFSLTGLNRPQGVYVSALTGEIWVGNTQAQRATRFPRFEQLAANNRSDYEIPAAGPLALTLDAFGNLYIADATNRIAIYYNGLAQQIAGNFAERPLSPGVIGIVYPRGQGVTFNTETRAFDEFPNPVPLPTEILDTQVLLNDQPVPLYFVSPLQINFLVPMKTADNGTAELQVLRPSTGQILAAGTVGLSTVSPALFIHGNGDQGQVSALNQDNTVNSAENPISIGQVIQLFGTGQGFIQNAPADGTPPSEAVSTSEKPRVLINTQFLDDADVQYSGLAPSLVGVWQINAKIPANVAPSAAVDVVVIQRSTPSNIGSGGRRLRTTIAVKP